MCQVFLFGKFAITLKGGFMNIQDCKMLSDRLKGCQTIPIVLNDNLLTLKRIFDHEVENFLSFRSFSDYNF